MKYRGHINGLFGSVLGGLIAQQFGWPVASITVGAGGPVLVVIFPMVVR